MFPDSWSTKTKIRVTLIRLKYRLQDWWKWFKRKTYHRLRWHTYVRLRWWWRTRKKGCIKITVVTDIIDDSEF